MDEIRQRIENKDYQGLITLCESFEFELAIVPISDLTISTVYSTLLAAYLVVNDLNSARFLRKRVMQHYKRESDVPEEINAVWKVGAAFWNRSLPEAYTALDSYAWSAEMKPLIAAVRETVQENAYALICRSFSCIKVTSAAQMLGIPHEALATALTKRGWLWDEETQLLKPTPIRKCHDMSTSGYYSSMLWNATAAPEQISLAQLSRLEDIVVYLESS